MRSARNFIRNFDLPLLISVLLLVSLGIVMIYSATYNTVNNTLLKDIHKKQMFWAIFALIAMLVAIAIPNKVFYGFS
ncbi:MAG TPA: hypothetical protein EYP53_03020, partial [Candidatus Latescibacteria bacterium]|nr:hypothetical protein [Candidatus Latescibacterota bacterium]